MTNQELRQYYVGQAIQGILASESEDHGFADVYTDPNTGKDTFRQEVYPINEVGREDYNKKPIKCPLRVTRAQKIVEEADAIAIAAVEQVTITQLYD
jgi:hypothetical protein